MFGSTAFQMQANLAFEQVPYQFRPNPGRAARHPERSAHRRARVPGISEETFGGDTGYQRCALSYRRYHTMRGKDRVAVICEAFGQFREGAIMHSRGSVRCRAAGVLSMALLVCCDVVLARDKTDVITLRNGDRVTGEIDKLEYGTLALKTDEMGTISIEWDAIATIQSRYSFDVEQIGGFRIHGTLAQSEETGGQLVVRTASDVHRIAPQNVIRISQLESTFWSRINGAFSLGYNFAKSTDVTVFSAQFDATYRGESITASLGVDTNSSKTPDRGTLDRDAISFAYRWLRPNRNFWAGLVNLERNEELGIDHRLQLGGGIGRYVYQTPHSEIAAVAGVTLNSEQAIDSSENQESTEGLLGASWRIWRLDSPKTSLASELAFYPSITENDRYRAHADVSLRREIITDFFIDLSFYYDYDSQPLSETGDNEDYGITTSLGYSF